MGGIQVPMLFITTKILNLSAIYVWLSFVAAEIGEIIIILIHYKKRKMENKKGIDKTKNNSDR